MSSCPAGQHVDENMIQTKTKYFLVLILLFTIIFSGCKSGEKENILFQVLDSKTTGLNFNNKLTYTQDLNLFKYMYFYNGAGVGAGDFNNDGRIDLFFAANQAENKLFLNDGDMKFRDVTRQAKIPEDGGWSTGVSVVDINNDGLLDIYICRVSQYQGLKGENQFLVCQGIDQNGIPYYADKAKDYGLNFSGLSTQAAFFDYDGDGDLDMYLLNHSVHQNANFAERKRFIGTYSDVSGDRMYRNDGNKFTDVTKECGINSTVIGYGLGVVISDINLDGLPDIYIGNDFHENDYLYINKGHGKFNEELNSHMMHTSQYSMGVDAADINNDGLPEIVSMDMLADDPYILKRSLGEDEYDLYRQKLGYGYNHQYTRNNLQLNRGNGMFSETGLYSGVFATDWSWAPLWMDFDNDGLKDLFISNGIPKRMNDIDYINYISNREMQGKINNNQIEETNLSLIDKFPQIKIPNKFYRNTGELVFQDLGKQIGDNVGTYSNGAVYADLDNDGDLDVVVNNIDETALIYENKCDDKKDKPYFDLELKGPKGNINAIGSKLYVFAKDEVYANEKFPVHGFLSSMEIPLHIGMNQVQPDSILLVWPDNTYEHIKFDSSHASVSYKAGLPIFNYTTITARTKHWSNPVHDITGEVKLNYRHIENPFPEFDREPLLPHLLSTEGPAIAVADINKDGLDDVFIGASKTGKPAIFIQTKEGQFIKTSQPGMEVDSMYEDVDACWIDVDKDGDLDLVVSSGGNEFYGQDEHLLPRVYLNDGQANFSLKKDAFHDLYQTASCIVPTDFNGDGFVDLFLGGRAVPFYYGEIPRSYLLQNDGTGKFTDVTSSYSKELMNIGMVTGAVWVDLNKDGANDLVICSEWGGIDAFIREKNDFKKVSLTDRHGWWNCIVPLDIDHDGDIDFIAGNLGLNSRLKASEKSPVRLYYNDFDDNGKKDQVLTYYVEGKEIPFANKMELEKQMPVLKKKFLYAEDFAKASLKEIFTQEKLSSARVLSADYFENAVLINDGNMKFHLEALPKMAQLTSYRDAIEINPGDRNTTEILLVGNYYDNNIQMGRYDADYVTVLSCNRNRNLNCESLNGLVIEGESRHVRKINIVNRKETYIIARNNDSLKVVAFGQK